MTQSVVGSFALVGVGLGDERDLTIRGLELARSVDVVFIEAYTAILADAARLESSIGRPIVTADRTMVESGDVLRPCLCEGKSVAMLVVGDPFGATTHSDVVVRCHDAKIPLAVVHNASIMNAVGCCGLQLYRFGQTISLCFWTDTWRPSSWFPKIVSNRVSGLHTLVLLDIKVKEVSDANLARGRTNVFEPPRFMSARQGAQQLLAMGDTSGVLSTSTVVVALGRVGATDQRIVISTLGDIANTDYLGDPLHCLVVAGDVHECEAEHASLYATAQLGSTLAGVRSRMVQNRMSNEAIAAQLMRQVEEIRRGPLKEEILEAPSRH